MSLKYNNTTITDVTYNGKPVYKIIYVIPSAHSSTVVFQKTLSKTENLSFLYYANSSTGAYVEFSYPTTQSLSLGNIPIKVTSMKVTNFGAEGATVSTINSDGLSGTFKIPKDNQTASNPTKYSNFITLNWTISNNKLTFTNGSSSTSGTVTSFVIALTYEYLAI